MPLPCPRCLNGQVLGDVNWASCLCCGYVYADSGHRFNGMLIATIYKYPLKLGKGKPEARQKPKTIKSVVINQPESEDLRKLKEYYQRMSRG